MTQRIDLTGNTFGAWTVLEFAGTRVVGTKGALKPFWLCRCDCGTLRQVEGSTLRNGLSSGCGCTKKLAISKAQTKHGHAKPGEFSTTYSSWSAMRARTRGNSAHGEKYYKGRGIIVCDRWNSFELFLADMGERPAGTTLDRYPDTNGNYEPGNCRWATAIEQANNRTDNVLIVYKGKCQSIAQWSTELGIHRSTITQRLKAGETNPENIFDPRMTPGVKR